MDRVKILVERRDDLGKEKVKKIRKQGCVPAVVYSEDLNMPLLIPVNGLKILKSIHFSESAIIDMEISNEKKHKSIPVIIKDTQYHPLSDEVVHIDFLKVSLKEKIKVHVPIILKGENPAVKEGEAVLEQVLRELEVEALPLDIPEKIEVDISELTVGHSLHVGSLQVAPVVRIVTDPKATVATVVIKKEEEIEEPPMEGEEAPPTEPEVIKEKKEGEAEPEATEEKPKKEKPIKEQEKR